MLLGLFRGLVTYKRTMDKIEMFLKYPSLFLDTNMSARQFGPPHSRGNNLRIDGNASGTVDGLLFVSGLPRRLSSDSYYSSGMVCGLESLPEVTVSKEGRYDVKYKTQKLIYETNSYSIGGRNYQNFSKIMFQDIKTTAFVDNMPGAKEIMQRYVQEYPFDDSQSGWNTDLRPVLFPIEVTSDQLEKVDRQLSEIINHHINGPEVFTPGKNYTYDLQLPARTGIDVMHRQNNTSHPMTPTITWWAPKKSTPRLSRGGSVKQPYYAKDAVSDFEVSFNINNEHQEKHTIYLLVSWQNPTYDGRSRAGGMGGNSGRLVYPVIQGLMLKYHIPGLTTRCRNFATDTNEGLQILHKRKVTDRTKKRPSQGTYKGKYEGYETIKYNGKTYFSLSNEYALSAHMSDCLPNITTHPSKDGRLPMHLSAYEALERPSVEVKPLQVGHLELRRLGAPDKKLVGAEILSDLLMPSMPDIILNIDTPIKVTDNETYVSGEVCYGHCVEGETDGHVSVAVPAGLYTVKRVERCSLGHDVGRAEYVQGFGDICNEVITIRKMLTQLNVAYDEIRANYVGSAPTKPTNTGQTNSALWRLG